MGKPHTLTCIQVSIKVVKTFKYLGSLITWTGQGTNEIESWLGRPRANLARLQDCLRDLPPQRHDP